MIQPADMPEMVRTAMMYCDDYRTARNLVEDLYCDSHNLWTTLEGNTAESDIEWFAKWLWERCDGGLFAGRWETIEEHERGKWRDVAKETLNALPYLMSRIANRCRAFSEAAKLALTEKTG